MSTQRPPSAAAVDGPTAVPDGATGPPPRRCELLLVADRSRGATHRFFGGWRFEVVEFAAPSGPGATLYVAPVAPSDLDGPGRRYDLVLLGEPPGSRWVDRSRFSWKATEDPGTPDPLAAALERAHEWLAAAGWQPDPLGPTHYHKSGRVTAATAGTTGAGHAAIAVTAPPATGVPPTG